MSLIKLYSTGCPKCKILKTKLMEKKIVFEEINDTELMLLKGFVCVPMMEIDDNVYDFATAIKWIGEIK